MGDSPSEAPGSLEQVRTLLNSWHLPHRPRVPVDDLPAWAADPAAWARRLPGIPMPSADGLMDVTALRDALREALGQAAPRDLEPWLTDHPVVAGIGADGGVTYRGRPGAVGEILAVVVAALAAGRWARLKACPDCRHVFYDHSRNGRRTWCAMYAGTPDGRACGTIAKVRTYRSRQRPTARSAR